MVKGDALNILLLEDNVDLAAMLIEILELRGHRVMYGQGGYAGIELLNTATTLPDIIICDLFMPDLDGHSVLKQVRANSRWNAIPFVIMSASTSERDRNTVMAKGADDFISKPFTIQELDRVLERWDNQRSGS